MINQIGYCRTKFCWSITLRPLCFLILLAFSGFIITKLFLMTKRIEDSVRLQSIHVRNNSFKEIDTTAKLILPQNSSASNLARALSSCLDGTQLSFLAIQTKVAPTLFFALLTVPHLSQASYIGPDGLLYSFYNEGDGTFAVYCNKSFSSEWYTQRVDRDTGKLYGEAVVSSSMVSLNESWIQKALNRSEVYSLVGRGWNTERDMLFLHTVAMDGRGVISLGFPAKLVVDHFMAMDFQDKDFHLATIDGEVLVQTKLPNTQIAVSKDTGMVSLQFMNLNDGSNGEVHNYSCIPDVDGDSENHHAQIMGKKHIFYCSFLEIAGVPSVYVLAFPKKGLESLVHVNSKITLTLHVLMFVMAERKSMNKSLAFASASHDVRASLATITGYIELSLEHATRDSGLADNLVKMNTCAMDLLGIFDSVLDTSKVEAGKMQLEEEDFNLIQLLEDVVDMYYPIGMKKGIDIVFDTCDGSILKLYLVTGDRGKLKQILCNLVGNAVKFTSEGHVSVRAVVQKTSRENAIIASNRNGVLNCLSRLCNKNNNGFGNLDDLHTVQQNPNCMEYVIEVEDTGKGIPKDKQKSVFENFVQDKETGLGQGGCGLGLGIVQSMVRLMGGEIKIVDKDPGDRGTCFRFSVFLATCGPVSHGTEQEDYPNKHRDGFPADYHQHFGLNSRSHVVLLIAGEERRRILKKMIESLGIKVSFPKRGNDLFLVLEKIKHNLVLSKFSSSERHELIDYLNKSASSNSSSGAIEGAWGSKDGSDYATQTCRKSNSKGSSSFILVVIDPSAGSFSELCSLVANFRGDIQNSQCKVVWLDSPIMHSTHSKEPEEDRPAPPCDHLLSKPFHGSRIYRVLGLLPEFGGTYQCDMLGLRVQTSQEMQHVIKPNASNELTCSGNQVETMTSHPLQQIVVHGCVEQSSERPLTRKRVLVVEDSELLRKLAAKKLCKLGADVDQCCNGKEAFDRVCRVLHDLRRDGHHKVLPYDYILMDCEMPIMDGFEATRLIRMEEKHHDIHIPIIALTAHAMDEEVGKTIQTGMDFHLTKPLQLDKLLDVIRSIRV